MIQLSAAIMHAPWARNRVPYVLNIKRELQRAHIPVTVVEDKKREGCWPTSRRARLAIAAGATHQLVVQDDMILCARFADLMADAVAANPAAIISFYCPYKKLMQAKGVSSWGVMVGKAYTTALVMPVELAREFVAYGDRVVTDSKSDDWRLCLFAESRGLKVWTTAPSLAQHAMPLESLMGHSSAVLIRQAPWFDPAPRRIDWTKGLTAPLVVVKTKVPQPLGTQ